MAGEPRKSMLRMDGQNLETEHHGPAPENAPTIVMLHEGLGSVSAWRDWPAELARRTGFGVFVYSRAGYGSSSPVSLPRPLTYMHHEAQQVLPALLKIAGIRKSILLGHSDGASIALIHAGSPIRHSSVRGLALLSPHVFCEEQSIAGIVHAREAYEKTELRARLSKYHHDVDNAFWGWNRAWLDTEFRTWNIEEFLPKIDLPTLVIQQEGDPYGTLAQLDAIEAKSGGSTDMLVLKGNGHFPQKENREETTAAIVQFANKLLAS